MIEKITLANSHLPQIIGFELMTIGYTLGNKFTFQKLNKSNYF